MNRSDFSRVVEWLCLFSSIIVFIVVGLVFFIGFWLFCLFVIKVFFLLRSRIR